MKQGIATGNTEKPQYQQPMWSNTFLTAQNVHFFSLHKNIFPCTTLYLLHITTTCINFTKQMC